MSEKKIEPFVFDWANEPEGFLKWFLPTVLSGEPLDEHMDELTARTKKFSDVRVRVLINGFEVDAKSFLTGVENNIEYLAGKQARRMLDEVGGLDDLEERIASIRTLLVRQFEQALAARGIELPSEDY